MTSIHSIYLSKGACDRRARTLLKTAPGSLRTTAIILASFGQKLGEKLNKKYFVNFLKILIFQVLNGPCASKPKRAMTFKYVSPRVKVGGGACQQIGVNGVDTLQAAEPPCSVTGGPVKMNLETSVSGGLIYKKTESQSKSSSGN